MYEYIFGNLLGLCFQKRVTTQGQHTQLRGGGHFNAPLLFVKDDCSVWASSRGLAKLPTGRYFSSPNGNDFGLFYCSIESHCLQQMMVWHCWACHCSGKVIMSVKISCYLVTLLIDQLRPALFFSEPLVPSLTRTGRREQ